MGYMWNVYRRQPVLFSPLSPLDTLTLTQRCVDVARRRAPHVVRQTEIAAPSPAALINPSLSEAVLLGLGTVITSLHLLLPQPSVQRCERAPEGCKVASAAFQVVKLGSSPDSACI